MQRHSITSVNESPKGRRISLSSRAIRRVSDHVIKKGRPQKVKPLRTKTAVELLEEFSKVPVKRTVGKVTRRVRKD